MLGKLFTHNEPQIAGIDGTNQTGNKDSVWQETELSVTNEMSHCDKPPEVDPREIQTALIYELYRQGLPGIIGAVIAAIAMTMCLWGTTDGTLLSIWVIGFAVWLFLRLYLGFLFQRKAPKYPEVIYWGHWFSFGTIVGALFWSAVPIFFYPSGDIIRHMLMTYILGALCLGIIVANSAVRLAHVPFILIISVSMMARTYIEGGRQYFLMAFLWIALAIYLIEAARRFHNAMVNSFKLTLQNSAFIAKLTEKNKQAQRLNRELQQEITERKRIEEELKEAGRTLESRVHDRTLELTEMNARFALEIQERKNVEKALRESEEKYRAHFEQINEVVFSYDRQFTIIEISPSMERLLGYSSEELIGKSIPQIGHIFSVDEMPRAFQDASRVLEGERINSAIYHFTTRDGQILVGEVSGAPLIKNGEIVGVVSVARDITEKMAAEQALRESEEKYRVVIENAAEGICVIQSRFIEFLNSHGKMILDRPDNEIFQTPFSDFIHPDDREKVLNYHYNWNDNKTDPLVHSFRILGSRGEVKWVSSKSVVIDWNGEPGLLSFITDITARRKADSEFKQISARMDGLLSATPDMICIQDTQGKYIVVNKAFSEMAGLPENQILGKTTMEVFPEALSSTCLNLSGKVMDTMRPVDDECSFNVNGRTVHLQISKFPIFDNPGEIMGIGAIIRDATQRKNLEEQLRQAQKMQAVGTLAGGIAHDFNNILQVISGYAELSLMKLKETDKHYSDFKTIHQASGMGNDLVKQLLMFSKKGSSVQVAVNLNKQVVGLRNLLERTIPKMIDFHLNLTEDLPNIKADPTQMEQIIMNLVVNARDAMNEGGRLTISTSLVESPDSVGIPTDGKYVKLSVSDTGKGIETNVIPHIFDPFFTTKELGRGTGLGLATVYGIVERYNGHISCSSELGQGTRFDVLFPAYFDADPPIEPPGNPPKLSTSGTEQLLLVDDDVAVRNLAQNILQGAGFKILTASDGIEALEIYAERKSEISAIILDLIMPRMGGMECIRGILAINPEAKVIISSGCSPEANLAVQTGAKSLLEKPYEIEQLLGTVRKVLDLPIGSGFIIGTVSENGSVRE